ncbi:dCTP deaminase [Geomonas paludis]|uniref:dCTP deaminase n=1 Tax=Geomonas paludis TaxID=2740185 RepID=A0A6V8MSV2_9BACT|nr:dCTP deaminase [Geomonas paludis]UPU35908.1 dCTP deaminase [Geomonas paludis]GFO62509.1 dCTP deaminase [Geomonas paludis]
MPVLIGQEIKDAIARGEIGIDPLEESQIGPGSLDLTLGNEFRIFKKESGVCHVHNESDFADVTEAVTVPDGSFITIAPCEMILGITRERITLADTMAGWLEGRSRFARFGLAVHVTAGFMQPGISNQQVLEIVNLGHKTLALYPGTRICQFVFERCLGTAKYQGRFADQAKP